MECRLSCCLFLIFSIFVACAHSISPLLGVHPLDEKYYASQVIKCKDGSKSFTKDRLNDNFCDCFDGTDEPGTSACPSGKFYCMNVGSTPRFIFPSRVNDLICDCCDGSDEYDGTIRCPNTCVMGGNLEYNARHHFRTVTHLDSIDVAESKGVDSQDFLPKVKGLKAIIILQVALVTCVAIYRIYHRHARYRKKHHR